MGVEKGWFSISPLKVGFGSSAICATKSHRYSALVLPLIAGPTLVGFMCPFTRCARFLLMGRYLHSRHLQSHCGIRSMSFAVAALQSNGSEFSSRSLNQSGEFGARFLRNLQLLCVDNITVSYSCINQSFAPTQSCFREKNSSQPWVHILKLWHVLTLRLTSDLTRILRSTLTQLLVLRYSLTYVFILPGRNMLSDILPDLYSEALTDICLEKTTFNQLMPF